MACNWWMCLTYRHEDKINALPQELIEDCPDVVVFNPDIQHQRTPVLLGPLNCTVHALTQWQRACREITHMASRGVG